MNYDLLLPRENEAELAKEAKSLGITPIFLYDFKNPKEIQKKREALKALGIPHYVGICVKPNSMGDIKKAAKLWLYADFLAVIDPGDFVRASVSNPRIDAVFRVPSGVGKDSVEYRRSNFNSVLANLARRNGVAYGLDFSYFLNSSGYRRAKILGREMQNVLLCRRKVPILMASLASEPYEMRLPENLSALSRVLGLTHEQSKASNSSHYESIIKRKHKRRSPEYVRPGVELVK